MISTPLATEVSRSLSVAEAGALSEQESIIERGLQTFYEVGSALLAIRDQRLYRQSHATFEDYCQGRWGWKRAHAYRLIDAAGVVSNLSPIGDILPLNEAQARPLAVLPPEQQRTAWREAVETAPGGKPTAAHVAATVSRVQQKSAQPEPPQRPTMLPAASERVALEIAEHEAAIDGLDRLMGGGLSRSNARGTVENAINTVATSNAEMIAQAVDEDAFVMTFDASVGSLERWIARYRAARAKQHRVLTLVPKEA